MPQTISLTGPSCTTSPLRKVRSVAFLTSVPRTMPGPIGQNPSIPLTRSMEPASVPRKSCAPTSLAGEKPARRSQTSVGETFLIGRPTTAAISPS